MEIHKNPVHKIFARMLAIGSLRGHLGLNTQASRIEQTSSDDARTQRQFPPEQSDCHVADVAFKFGLRKMFRTIFLD